MAERASKRRKLLQYPLVLDGQDCPSGKRSVRSKAEHHAVEQGKRVELANTLDSADFERLYHPKTLVEELCSTKFKIVPNEETSSVGSVFTAPDPSSALLDDCFDLVQRLTGDDYANSEMKWSAAKKKVEMRLPDLKYFIVTAEKVLEVVGFISFMVTYEDGHEVLYIYEIHIEPHYQGKGLGRQLMGIAEQTARNVGLEKVMLTVFRSNTRAITFYETLGYSIDKYSPQPKVLRNGTLKERSYVILSKILGQDDAPEYSKEAEHETKKDAKKQSEIEFGDGTEGGWRKTLRDIIRRKLVESYASATKCKREIEKEAEFAVEEHFRKVLENVERHVNAEGGGHSQMIRLLERELASKKSG